MEEAEVLKVGVDSQVEDQSQGVAWMGVAFFELLVDVENLSHHH